MIPKYNESGVLPPFLPGCNPAQKAATAPYKTKLEDFVIHFASSDKRKEILDGLLKYRSSLKDIGIRNGFQWIDGSFIENVEDTRKRPPSDIDIITFANRPDSCTTDDEWIEYVSKNAELFDPRMTKEKYQCDAYFLDLNLPSSTIVRSTTYWFGLFSHQRETYLWKGLLEIGLDDNEHPLFDLLMQEVEK